MVTINLLLAVYRLGNLVDAIEKYRDYATESQKTHLEDLLKDVKPFYKRLVEESHSQAPKLPGIIVDDKTLHIITSLEKHYLKVVMGPAAVTDDNK